MASLSKAALKRQAKGHSDLEKTTPTEHYVRPLSRNWYLLPLGVFLFSRLLSALLILVHRDQYQAYSSLYFQRDYNSKNYLLTQLTTWDAQWYWKIAENGYPRTLPMFNGEVDFNAWAFYPLWPSMVRSGMELTGLSFPVVAVSLSLIFSSVAVTLLYRLVRETANVELAILPILFVSFGPGNFVFSTAYAESLALLLLVLTLIALRRRRWIWLFILITLFAFARPIALPLAAVAGTLFLFQVMKSRAVLKKENILLLTVAIYSALSFAFWPIVAALITDNPSAFLDTQEAWRRSSTGSWLELILSGVDGPANEYRIIAIVLAPIMAAAMLLPRRNGYPLEIRLWGFFYLAYLMVTLGAGGLYHVNSGMGRYFMLALLPLLPFAWFVSKLETKQRKAAFVLSVLVMLIVGTMIADHLIVNNLIESPSRVVPI